MRKLSGEFERVRSMLNIGVRDWVERSPINPPDGEPPVGINVEDIVFGVEREFLEKVFPSHNEDEVPDTVGFARQIFCELVLMKDFIFRGQSRVDMNKGSKESPGSEAGKPPRHINCS